MLVCVLLLISSFVIVMAYATLIEKNSTELEICKYCGEQMVEFDEYSQGARGYECPECGYTTWMEYDG